MVWKLRARAESTSAFRIPYAQHLWLGLNREILNVARATSAISLNPTTQICGTFGRGKPGVFCVSPERSESVGAGLRRRINTSALISVHGERWS